LGLDYEPAHVQPVATLFGSLPVYDTTPPAQPAPVQEPVADGLIRGYINALVANKHDEAADATKRMVDYVFATPPAAQRKPLFFKEICEAEVIATDDHGNFSLLKFARAIEAAHNIKEGT
jgi:hypothetical protein